MKCNPLVCFANAYDCKEAIESFIDLPCDKLRLDYFEYPYTIPMIFVFFTITSRVFILNTPNPIIFYFRHLGNPHKLRMLLLE